MTRTDHPNGGPLLPLKRSLGIIWSVSFWNTVDGSEIPRPTTFWIYVKPVQPETSTGEFTGFLNHRQLCWMLSLGINRHILRWWLGCPITSSTFYLGSMLPFSEGDWIPRVSKLGGGFKYFLVFPPTWGNDPIWLIFFKWDGTEGIFSCNEYSWFLWVFM